MNSTLNFKHRSRIIEATDICKRTLAIEFELDWSVGLGATLGDDHTEN